MNPLSSILNRCQKFTWKQWLVLGWLLALNMLPYVVTILTSGGLGNLHWVIWSLLSGPFALIGMLSFLTVAGAWPVMARRLLWASGSLLLIGGLMLLLEEEIVGTSAWFLLEGTIIVAMTLLSCRILGLPARPARWSLQFSLAEIILLSGLAGVFLLMLRLAEATDLQLWKQAQEIVFVAFTITSAIYLVPICLAMVAASRRGIIAWVGLSLLLWAVTPLAFSFAMQGSLPLQPGERLFLFILYPTLGAQALLVWGTLFPIRIFFPGVLFIGDASSATNLQCKSDTLVDDPANCRQSEHTDVPD